MEFFEVVKERKSVRTYANTKIEETKIRRILEAANRSPSAGNLQAYEIFAVTRPSCRRELAEASLQQEFVAAAPLVLVFCAHPELSRVKYGERGAQLYSVQDATIACCFAMLAAADLGLATVWVGAFNDQGVRKAIGTGEELIPVAILPVGYPAEQPPPTSRRDLDQLVHYIDGE